VMMGHCQADSTQLRDGSLLADTDALLTLYLCSIFKVSLQKMQ